MQRTEKQFIELATRRTKIKKEILKNGYAFISKKSGLPFGLLR
jgi:hypothetical protein